MKLSKREMFVMGVAYSLSKLLKVEIIMITRAQLDEITNKTLDKIHWAKTVNDLRAE